MCIEWQSIYEVRSALALLGWTTVLTNRLFVPTIEDLHENAKIIIIRSLTAEDMNLESC